MNNAAEPEREVVAQGWDKSEEEAKRGGAWIKLESGKSIELCIVGEPSVFLASFQIGDEPARDVHRWSMDVFVPDSGEMKTWECSKTVFAAVVRQRKLRGDKFTDALFLLERQGVDRHTRYSLDYIRQLEPAEIEQRDALVKTGAADNMPF